MTVVVLFDTVGDFGEDKDIAAALRENTIKVCIEQNRNIILDFGGVTLVTQSFIHAMISDVLRNYGEDVLNIVEFKNCSEVVKGIISTVVQYSLDTIAD